MMMHNVYFWLKDGVSEAEKRGFELGLKDLVHGVPEIHLAHIGKPAKTKDRDVVDHSFAYSLFIQFRTIADHDVYQDHRVHKAFVEKYSLLWDRVTVYDHEFLV